MTETITAVDAALDYLRSHAEEGLKALDDFLRIPSVSADPEMRGEVERAAQWVAAELTRIGVENATLRRYAVVVSPAMNTGSRASCAR